MNGEKNSILEGAIFPSLMKFAFPILFSLFLQAFYGAADLWMVSRFGTNADVSAVATGTQTMYIVNGIVTGLAMGVTILIGQSMGEKNYRRCADIIGTGLGIFAVAGIILTAVLVSASSLIAEMLNAPGDAFGRTVSYISICGGGTLFVVAYNVLNAIFCGIGDSKTPLIFVAIACLLNISADYILIKYCGLGASGAAVATIAAQAVSVIMSLFIIRKRLPFSFTRENMKFNRKISLRCLKLGAPVALLRMCAEISFLVMLGFVNRLGVSASSGVGIAEKLVMFILLIPTAYMSAISAFVAQNTGAGNDMRSEKSVWAGVVTAAAIGGIMAYITFFHGDFLASLFIDDTDVTAAAAEFLKATSIECFILSIAYCFNGYFNGIGKTAFVMIQGICAALCVRVPYAYFASSRPDPSLFNVGLATSLAALFMFVTAIIYFIYLKKKV